MLGGIAEMPAPGLSLVGFMTEEEGVNYLISSCDCGTEDPTAMFAAAQANLGAPIDNAGQPEILDIPEEFNDYLEGVQRNPRFAQTVEPLTWAFKLIEADPLISFQFHIFTERS